MAMGWPELLARVVRQYVLPQDGLRKFQTGLGWLVITDQDIAGLHCLEAIRPDEAGANYGIQEVQDCLIFGILLYSVVSCPLAACFLYLLPSL